MRNWLFGTATAVSFLVLFGCGTSGPEVSTVAVERKNHTFEVSAIGEIIATEEVPIGVPRDVNMSFQILWLLPEYSEVTEGEVIARFDDAAVITDLERRELEAEQKELQLENYYRQADSTLTQIDHNMLRVEGETDIAMAYDGVNEEVFSRNELIDAVENIEFLEIQNQFYEWQRNSHQRRVEADTTKLQVEKDTAVEEIENNKQALQVMELKSPADGTFLYARSRWGQKVGIGQSVWRGSLVGFLPVKGKVAAEVYILEVDAVGLEQDQQVFVRIDSDTSRLFTGRVEKVPNMASTLSRGDPTKYFKVSVVFDEVDADLMRVGSTLTATIVTGDLTDAVLIPRQAVFYNEDQPFVYVVDSKGIQQREVGLGRRSPTLIEVVSGLDEGEQISLVEPQNIQA